jgi:large conductance mechanosensitive channel
MSTTSLLGEFRSFALKGNVIDLAVAVVIGAAFGKIITAVVSDVIMPFVSLALPSGNWRTSGIVLRHAADAKDDIVLRYGDLLGAVIDFVAIALILFLVVSKLIQRNAVAPKTKECPFCLDTIPLAATRCRACTSEVSEAT